MSECPVDFVFVHSYSSNMPNWQDVVIGDETRQGRLLRAQRLARDLQVPVIANDSFDARNDDLYRQHGVQNLRTALNTRDEVTSALAQSPRRAVLFVSSPDHLPRVVRDALRLGGSRCLFASSDVSFSEIGVNGVEVREPHHAKKPELR